MPSKIIVQKKIVVSVRDKNGDGDIIIDLSHDEIVITIYDGYESRFITIDHPVAKEFFDKLAQEV